jgi:hypothetical protein
LIIFIDIDYFFHSFIILFSTLPAIIAFPAMPLLPATPHSPPHAALRPLPHDSWLSHY